MVVISPRQNKCTVNSIFAFFGQSYREQNCYLLHHFREPPSTNTSILASKFLIIPWYPSCLAHSKAVLPWYFTFFPWYFTCKSMSVNDGASTRYAQCVSLLFASEYATFDKLFKLCSGYCSGLRWFIYLVRSLRISPLTFVWFVQLFTYTYTLYNWSTI